MQISAIFYDLLLIHINKLTRKTPIPAPQVNNVTTWIALIQSLPASVVKFQNERAIMKKAISIPLSGDLCLINYFLNFAEYTGVFRL